MSSWCSDRRLRHSVLSAEVLLDLLNRPYILLVLVQAPES